MTTFHYGPEPVPVTIKPEHGVHHLYAPRRTVLDRILVEAAEAAGAEVHHGVLLSQHPIQLATAGSSARCFATAAVGRATIAADLVIGADGRDSTVAKLVAAESYLAGRASSALVYGYFEGLPDDGLHWYFAQGAAAGVIPTNRGQHCVFVGLPQRTIRGRVPWRCRAGIPRPAWKMRSGAQGRGRRRSALGSFARVCRCPWLLAPAIRSRVGSRRRCRLLQGPSHGTRHDRCAARRRAAGARYSCRRASRQWRGTSKSATFSLSRSSRSTDAIASFQWTLDEVKALHGLLSAAMRSETNHMVQPAAAVRLHETTGETDEHTEFAMDPNDRRPASGWRNGGEGSGGHRCATSRYSPR